MHPDAPMYTFWDYKRNRWPRDAGLRIDHLLLNPKAAKRLVEAGVDREVRGLEGASDHAPAWIVLRDKPAMRRKAVQRVKTTSEAEESEAALGTRRRLLRRPLLVIDGDSFAHRSYHAFRKRSWGVDASLPAPFSVLPICCCDFTARSSHAPCSSPGTRWKPPPIGMRNFRPTKADANSTTHCSSNLRCCRNLLPPAAFRMQKRQASRQTTFSPLLLQKKKSAAVSSSLRAVTATRFQLASDRTTILYPIRAGEMARIGPDEVRARYGVDPAQVPDFIALRGDPSDKLPGAPGVGAAGAATLLQRYGTLEAALAAGRFPAQAENLRLYRSIATMNKKAPLPSLRNQKPTWGKAADLAGRWQLKQLADRLDELGR